jgi:phage/plasmid-associated DNA primase
VLFKDAISARLCTVIVRAYNRTIEVPDGSEGLDRRVVVVPFNHQPKEVDLELSEKLQKELSGIFAWAWSVPMAEVKRRLTWAGAVPAVAEASIKRFEANNPEYCFLADVFPDGNEQVKAGDLYSSYVEWCKESGYSPKKIRKFVEAVQALGCQRSAKAHGCFYYSIPSMSKFDLIEHMGLRQNTKKRFSRH